MSGVQFGQQIDMNGNKITEGAAATNPTDFVILSQLAASAPRGYAQNLGDGVNTTFTVNHAFALADFNDFVARIAEVATGQEYMAEVTAVDSDNLSVTFGFVPTTGQFRIAVVPVP